MREEAQLALAHFVRESRSAVDRLLAKEKAAGSNPVSRSIKSSYFLIFTTYTRGTDCLSTTYSKSPILSKEPSNLSALQR